MAEQPQTHTATSPLTQALGEIAERVTRYLDRSERIGEQNTKATLIVPVLRALGWNVEDLDEVHLEYKGVPIDRPVDYALMLQRKPVLFIEAKGLGENLGDRRFTTQIISYAAVAGVEWVVLTDGDEYRIYNALSSHDIDERLFRAVHLTRDRAEAEEALRLLTKEELRNKSLGALWKANAIDTKVRRAVEALFAPEPSPWLVRRLTNATEGLTAGDVKAALLRLRLTLDLAPREPGPPEPPPPEPPPPEPPPPEPPPPGGDLMLKQLLDAGLIRPGQELRKRYLGSEAKATVEPDGRVRCGSELFKSLSTAAGAARVAIKGPPPDGRRYYQTNGWTFWEYEAEAGKWRAIQEVRERYLAARPLARPAESSEDAERGSGTSAVPSSPDPA